jgi:predicted enzyme related to lactoylglutathione lyase
MALRIDALCVDATDVRRLASWWAEVLGWPQEVSDDGDVILRAPAGAGPDWLFLAVPEPKTVKNRLHVDFTPDDQQAEVDRLITLGARHVDIGQGQQSWVVLADPEGNEFCVLAAD